MSNPLASLHRLVWTALLAALIGVGAFIHFPLGPIPISLQTFFILLAGFILGPIQGAVCVGLYLAAGLIGLPVFSGGKAGLGHLLGPTGGFLLGFIPAALAAGLGARGRGFSWVRTLAGGLAGFAVMYCLGLIWLKFSLGFDWTKTLAVGLLPFVPGDAIKLVAAVGFYKYLTTKKLAPQ
ncbi:MAG: biotin transporter BioY [Pseudomonadota bacterium]